MPVVPNQQPTNALQGPMGSSTGQFASGPSSVMPAGTAGAPGPTPAPDAAAASGPGQGGAATAQTAQQALPAAQQAAGMAPTPHKEAVKHQQGHRVKLQGSHRVLPLCLGSCLTHKGR